MDKKVDLQSLVDSHDQPFMVIDRHYQVVAVNQAFEAAYKTSRAQVVGSRCYEVSHGNDQPCSEMGEDCPYDQVYETENPHSCLHSHRDNQGREHLVRLTVYPLRGADGELYLGESMQEHVILDNRRSGDVRMVGNSPAFLSTLEQLKLAARQHAPALLQGETGTGKELAADFIHRQSPRASGPFMTLDCTAMSESLFESEVFGYERGAFTGSVGQKHGLYELADRGTLFLDEVGDMPLALQAKFLRVLESGQFRRVGGHSNRHADVRIICATNRHLWDLVQAGEFRKDLYYRVACLCIHLPPLRERLQDIPILAEALLERVRGAGQGGYRLAPEALVVLQRHDYPGNVRELRNILCVAASRAERNGLIESEHIPDPVRMGAEAWETELRQACKGTAVAEVEAAPASEKRAGRSLKSVEARHIAELLEQHEGNRRQTAAALGISERTLYRKLRRYGLG